MRRGAACIVVLLSAAAAVPGASGSSAPTGWNGTNPFRCQLQQAGYGTAVPDPGADPYCVEFDKRRQNITQLGIADFLSKEPARVAAASGKCFYFQSDHWRASVVQDDGSTKLYEWDGHYFFDKARGEGGAWVTNFNVNGRTGDPSSIPGIPPEYAQYLGPGTGGAITHDDIPADPQCAAKAAAGGVYADPDPVASAALAAAAHPCADGAGAVTHRSIGPLAVGMSEGRARDLLGAPRDVQRGFLRWCLDGGGELRAGIPGDRSGSLGSDPRARIAVVLTTHVGHALHGVGPGRRVSGPDGVRAIGRDVVARVRGGRVRWLAVYDRTRIRSRAALASWLRRAAT